MRQGDMSNWIHFVLFLIHYHSNADTEVPSVVNLGLRWGSLYIQWKIRTAERIFYVSEETATADKAASVCTLATPAIQFWLNRNTVSFDDASLDIANGESVWSGYVQTYAAFLYEGCCEKAFANSEVVYTDIHRDPGECYSKCKTDIIGMQTTTCHCNPRPEKARKYAKGCDTACSNPPDTVCGGEKAVSMYRKVQYPGSDGRAETENCRALFWYYNGYQSYTWRSCSSIYAYMCVIDVSPSIKIECQGPSEAAWSTTTAMCLSYNKTPAGELSSRYPDFNCPKGKNIWIGQIRSRVIGNDADSNYQTPGWRRGVINKSGGLYLLQFDTDHPHLNSLCEYAPSSDSTAAPSSDSTIQSTSLKSATTTTFEGRNGGEQKSNKDNDQFPMIVVYAAVPAVLVIVVVVVIVILCKRRNVSKERTARHDVHRNSYVTNTTDPSQNSRAPEGTSSSARDDEYAVVTKKTKQKQPVTIDDNEYDTTVTVSSLKHTETDNTYNRLDDVTGNTDGRMGENCGNEVDLYDHAVSKVNPLKASKGRNIDQNATTATFPSLKHTDDTYNRLDDVTGNVDTHEFDGDNTDLYDHAVSTDTPTKASKGRNNDQGGLYDTALAVNRQGDTQTSALQDIYAQPIPRSQKK